MSISQKDGEKNTWRQKTQPLHEKQRPTFEVFLKRFASPLKKSGLVLFALFGLAILHKCAFDAQENFHIPKPEIEIKETTVAPSLSLKIRKPKKKNRPSTLRRLPQKLRNLLLECKSLAEATYQVPSGKPVLTCLERLDQNWHSWHSRQKNKSIGFREKDERIFVDSLSALQVFFFERSYARSRLGRKGSALWKEKFLHLKELWKDIKLTSRNREKLLDFHKKLLD